MDTSTKTPTSHGATTDLPPDDWLAYGRLLLQGVGVGKAAAQAWPDLKAPDAKATKVNKDPRFKAWLTAQKEIGEQHVRQITASLDCDYESRIVALARAFNDPEVKTRERLQIHDKLTAAEGRKTTKDKEPASGNSLKRLLQEIGAGAIGGALSTGVPHGRLPALRPPFPEDTEQDGLPRGDGALAPSDSVLGRQEVS